MRELKCVKELNGDLLRIVVRGQILHENSGEFESLLDELTAEGQEYVELDLTSADFLPSFCFGMLINFAQSVQEAGKKVRLLLKPHHIKLAKDIGLDSLMQLAAK